LISLLRSAWTEKINGKRAARDSFFGLFACSRLLSTGRNDCHCFCSKPCGPCIHGGF
jgi:hypothetical protein